MAKESIIIAIIQYVDSWLLSTISDAYTYDSVYLGAADTPNTNMPTNRKYKLLVRSIVRRATELRIMQIVKIGFLP